MMAPRLGRILNTWTLRGLPQWSAAPRGVGADDMVSAIVVAGYEGLQMEAGDPLMQAGFRAGVTMHAAARIVDPAQALPTLERLRDLGFALTTLHLGTGFDTTDEGYALVEALLEAISRSGHPAYVETHRATLTQDPRRTLDLIARYPELRFNADFSHWYTGCEMRYGDWDAKLAMLEPVFARTRYIHGRIGDSGALQVAVEDRDAPHVRDFRQLWTRAMQGFLANAAPSERLFFAPELLPYAVEVNGVMVYPAYARQRPLASGGDIDDSDRWLQALYLAQIAESCFQPLQETYGHS